MGSDPPPPIAGEILIIDDIETGLSPKNPKRNRPYVVVGCAGRRVRVMPQTTNTRNGVGVPGGTMDGLGEGGFVPCSTTIRLSLAVHCQCVGHLGHPYLAKVLSQARPKP